MGHSKLKATYLAVVVLAFVAALMLPGAAFAAQEEVQVTDYVAPQDATTSVSAITIGDVDAPAVGEAFDDTANVTTAEGQSWEIPVLWIGSDLQLATEAAEDVDYLPALAFYLPPDYSVSDVNADGAYAVKFSKELAELFGDNEVVSVYDSSTGITYILPASLRDFFAHPAVEAAAQTESSTQANHEDVEQNPLPRLVDLYCSQTAKDRLSQDDLEFLVDLILNKLEPQAVNLLREKFPAFDDAAACGEIGTRIGLYIYYEHGDDDGNEAHEYANSDSLAYVIGRPIKEGNEKKFVYMLGVNAAGCSKLDDDGNAVLIRKGTEFDDLCNTIVHEMFHAYMDDYNRAGMVGSVSEDELITDLSSMTDEEYARYMATHYPLWFIEGTASSVENVYQYRRGMFNLLTAEASDYGYAEGSAEAIVYNYLTATYEGKLVGYQLNYSAGGNIQGPDGTTVQIDPTASRYVSGYLAVLYLSEMMAKSDEEIGTSVSKAGGKTTYSSENIRMGLNRILERMHKGETLDGIIADISKDANGNSLYASTDDFQNRFICGEVVETNGQAMYAGDNPSIEFVTNFLNYMSSISSDTSREYIANGSILFDFDKDYVSPLDPEMTDSTDVLAIVEQNDFVESTVPNSSALANGGKSRTGAAGATQASAGSQQLSAANTADLAAAAKLVKAVDGEVEETAAATVTTAAAPTQVVAENAESATAEQTVSVSGADTVEQAATANEGTGEAGGAANGDVAEASAPAVGAAASEATVPAQAEVTAAVSSTASETSSAASEQATK